jgi:hypothetical protein
MASSLTRLNSTLRNLKLEFFLDPLNLRCLYERPLLRTDAPPRGLEASQGTGWQVELKLDS